MVPASVQRLAKLGLKISIESGTGTGAGFDDAAFLAAGASVVKDRRELLSRAGIILRVRKPPLDEVALMPEGAVHIGFLDPFNERDLVRRLAAQGVSAISVEMVPRTTKAQKMDALSSQANLAGYVAVILAAEQLNKIFPMMTTPAGTIQPARVFVIGAGVAGLQAIATAKRLGARVEAFDTRPIVEEQVRSLGARFVKIDVGETGQTKDGYAKPLTEAQLEIQRQGMARHCSQSDVVITTALLFGRTAPRLITADMVGGMSAGSVIVDLAVESGGNVEGSEVDRIVERSGVKIVGLANLPGRVAVHASQVYASNLAGMIEEYWDRKAQEFRLDPDDEILRGCLVTHQHQICSEQLKVLV
jgi:NAD(P) transhydrogenase subunit alpha